jgi:hypothetical protein
MSAITKPSAVSATRALSAKLGRPDRAADPDRTRVGVNERDATVGDRALPGQTQVGLGEDLLGGRELTLQPLDQRDADALATRIPARGACESVRLAHRLLGTLSDLRGQPIERP